MPPKAVRTIRDLIFWQYAKIISESAGIGKNQKGRRITPKRERLNNRLHIGALSLASSKEIESLRDPCGKLSIFLYSQLDCQKLNKFSFDDRSYDWSS